MLVPYQFLTGATGCTYTTTTITINPITPPTLLITQTQQNLCNGDTQWSYTREY
jgi:hypothetical protein